MENQIVIPKIVPLYYCGQAVLTTGQAAENFNCHCATIRAAFNRHRKNFIEGTDYFYLQNDKLSEFKDEQAANDCYTPAANDCYTPAANACNVPFSRLASSLYLWAESGVEKLAKYIGTDKAKLIYTALKFGYFQKANVNFKPQTTPRLAPPKPKKPKIKDNLTFEQLQFLISHCTDAKLRDELIKRASGNYEPPKCVYVLEMENGAVKIGMTKNFLQRARQIMAESGLQVKNWCHSEYLPAEIARDIENACHEQFEGCKVGNEFFETDFNSAVNELSKHAEINEYKNIE